MRIRHHLNGRQCVDCNQPHAAPNLTLADPSGWRGDVVNVLAAQKAGDALIQAEIDRCQIVCRECRVRRAEGEA